MRSFPALEVWFSDPVGAAVPLSERLLLLLDDFQPTAIEEVPAPTEQPAERWRVFFADPEDRDRAAGALAAAFEPSSVRVGRLDVPDDESSRRAQASLRAVRVSNLVVAPPWDIPDTASGPRARAEPAEPPEPLVIVIEPSMAFGTGHHASTRLCLRALQSVRVARRTVLDIGTGSGVLAIAAARLGARRVLAIDRDADAVDAARDNVRRNEVEAVVEVRQEDLEALGGERADLVLANLTAAALERSADRLRQAVDLEGHLILGGLTADEEAIVLAAYSPTDLVWREGEEDWVATVLRSQER